MSLKTTRHVFHVCTFSILVSQWFLAPGCSPKSDDTMAEQARAVEALRKEAEDLRTENAKLQEALTRALDERKRAYLLLAQEDTGAPDGLIHNILAQTAAAGVPGSEDSLQELQRLRQESSGLKKLLVETAEILRKQAGFASLAKDENARLEQENAALSKALAEATARFETQAASAPAAEAAHERKKYVESVIAELGSRISKERKLQLLESLAPLASTQDPYVIDVVQKALADSDLQVGRAAIQLLNDYATSEVLPVIDQALRSRDEQTRLEALAPLAGINDSKVLDLLTAAVGDRSEDVRTRALEIAGEHEDDIQLGVLKSAIRARHEDVRTEALSMLEFRADHGAVDIIIEGLRDGSSEFREAVNSALNFLIDQEFKDYDAARKWWEANRGKYDEDLTLID